MRHFIAILLISILSAMTPAHSQSEYESVTGSRIVEPKPASIPTSGRSQNDVGRIAMAEFARCTLDRFPSRVTKILSLPLGKDYDKAMADISSGDCLDSGEMKFSPLILRGALFTELWRRRVIAQDEGKSWAPILPVYDPSAPIVHSSPAVMQHQALLFFGDCVIKRDRSVASDVLTEPTASKAQDQAYSKLIPVLGPCLPKGQQFKITKPVLEGLLAEVLYREPNPPATETGAQ